MSEQSFSGSQAAQIAGITYRQLDYWARTNLIRPSLIDATGSGSRRSYVYRDLLELKVIKNLLDAGIKLEAVREVFNYLRAHVDTDIASAHIVISGKAVVLCQGDQLVARRFAPQSVGAQCDAACGECRDRHCHLGRQRRTYCGWGQC